MFDEAIKIQIGDSKYSQVFNGVGLGCGRFTRFIIRDQYIGLLRGHNFSFTVAQFNKVSGEETLYSDNVRL
jgi:hypothetical protein